MEVVVIGEFCMNVRKISCREVVLIGKKLYGRVEVLFMEVVVIGGFCVDV